MRPDLTVGQRALGATLRAQELVDGRDRPAGGLHVTKTARACWDDWVPGPGTADPGAPGPDQLATDHPARYRDLSRGDQSASRCSPTVNHRRV